MLCSQLGRGNHLATPPAQASLSLSPWGPAGSLTCEGSLAGLLCHQGQCSSDCSPNSLLMILRHSPRGSRIPTTLLISCEVPTGICSLPLFLLQLPFMHTSTHLEAAQRHPFLPPPSTDGGHTLPGGLVWIVPRAPVLRHRTVQTLGRDERLGYKRGGTFPPESQSIVAWAQSHRKLLWQFFGFCL